MHLRAGRCRLPVRVPDVLRRPARRPGRPSRLCSGGLEHVTWIDVEARVGRRDDLRGSVAPRVARSSRSGRAGAAARSRAGARRPPPASCSSRGSRPASSPRSTGSSRAGSRERRRARSARLLLRWRNRTGSGWAPLSRVPSRPWPLSTPPTDSGTRSPSPSSTATPTRSASASRLGSGSRRGRSLDAPRGLRDLRRHAP